MSRFLTCKEDKDLLVTFTLLIIPFGENIVEDYTRI